MKTHTGTCHFKNVLSAIHYYNPYGIDKKEVIRKIARKEIVIGNIPKNWRGYYDMNGRYIRTDI